MINNFSFSLTCQHCEDAPCVNACISGAMFKDEKTGETKCDTDKCVGCWMCIMVCPFGIIKQGKKNAVKCDLCPEREDFACVASCPTKALFGGTREEFQNKLNNSTTQ
ncbi:MAG: 4Fe-4S dicluster domain-containing protein [Candidatus Omnitrophota bacterium]